MNPLRDNNVAAQERAFQLERELMEKNQLIEKLSQPKKAKQIKPPRKLGMDRNHPQRDLAFGISLIIPIMLSLFFFISVFLAILCVIESCPFLAIMPGILAAIIVFVFVHDIYSRKHDPNYYVDILLDNS